MDKLRIRGGQRLKREVAIATSWPARCWRVIGKPAFRCLAAVPLARGRSISTPRGCSQTLVDRSYPLDRGYDRMDAKLRSVGANVERVS